MAPCTGAHLKARNATPTSLPEAKCARNEKQNVKVRRRRTTLHIVVARGGDRLNAIFRRPSPVKCAVQLGAVETKGPGRIARALCSAILAAGSGPVALRRGSRMRGRGVRLDMREARRRVAAEVMIVVADEAAAARIIEGVVVAPVSVRVRTIVAVVPSVVGCGAYAA